jgi:hypothetical protein
MTETLVYNTAQLHTGDSKMHSDITNDRQDILPVPGTTSPVGLFGRSEGEEFGDGVFENGPKVRTENNVNPFREPFGYVDHVPKAERHDDLLLIPEMQW